MVPPLENTEDGTKEFKTYDVFALQTSKKVPLGIGWISNSSEVKSLKSLQIFYLNLKVDTKQTTFDTNLIDIRSILNKIEEWLFNNFLTFWYLLYFQIY